MIPEHWRVVLVKHRPGFVTVTWDTGRAGELRYLAFAAESVDKVADAMLFFGSFKR